MPKQRDRGGQSIQGGMSEGSRITSQTLFNVVLTRLRRRDTVAKALSHELGLKGSSEGLLMTILPQAALSAILVLSAGASPQLLIGHFDSGSALLAVFESPTLIASSDIPNAHPSSTIEGQVGDAVSVPPVVQSFIKAYKDGRTKEALAAIFDPLLKLINEIPAETDKEKGDKDRLLDTFAAMRGMLRTQMTGPNGDADPPQEIRVIRSFKEDHEKVRVHLKIQHSKSVYYMRLVAQQTPIGVIITNIGFGDQDVFNK